MIKIQVKLIHLNDLLHFFIIICDFLYTFYNYKLILLISEQNYHGVRGLAYKLIVLYAF